MDAYKALRDYAAIGDCHGHALVAANGDVDWCCLERHDQDPVFCCLLDQALANEFHKQSGLVCFGNDPHLNALVPPLRFRLASHSNRKGLTIPFGHDPILIDTVAYKVIDNGLSTLGCQAQCIGMAELGPGVNTDLYTEVLILAEKFQHTAQFGISYRFEGWFIGFENNSIQGDNTSCLRRCKEDVLLHFPVFCWGGRG